MLLLFVLFSGDLMNSFLNFKMVMKMMMMIMIMMMITMMIIMMMMIMMMMIMMMMMMMMMIMMTIHITNIINEFYCDLRVKFKRKKLPQEKQKRSLKGNSSFRQDSNPCITDTSRQLSATN